MNRQISYKFALFDFSGTIANDLEPTWLTTCEILSRYGRIEPTLQQFREIFCLPYWKIFEYSLLPEDVAKNTCLNLYKRLFRKYEDRVKLFRDVKKSIQILAQTKGLGIVSQTPKKTIENFLEKNNLRKYFSVIVSLEDSVEHKPSPLPLFIAMENFNCKSDEVLYIGDMAEDVLAAKNARMTSIAISRKQSYHTYSRLLSVKPNFIISRLSELTSMEVIRC